MKMTEDAKLLDQCDAMRCDQFGVWCGRRKRAGWVRACMSLGRGGVKKEKSRPNELDDKCSALGRLRFQGGFRKTEGTQGAQLGAVACLNRFSEAAGRHSGSLRQVLRRLGHCHKFAQRG